MRFNWHISRFFFRSCLVLSCRLRNRKGRSGAQRRQGDGEKPSSSALLDASDIAEKGKPYTSRPEEERFLEKWEYPWIPLVLFVIAVATRFWRLEEPKGVVFDEHHFGGFTNKYLRGKYLFDIHPPLGKLTFVLFAWLFDYDPDTCSYDNIHDHYSPRCKFMILRVVAGAWGSGGRNHDWYIVLIQPPPFFFFFSRFVSWQQRSDASPCRCCIPLRDG